MMETDGGDGDGWWRWMMEMDGGGRWWRLMVEVHGGGGGGWWR